MTDNDSKAGKSRRHLKNFLLKPSLQMRMGVYYIIFALIFSVTLGVIFYLKLKGIVPLVLELTDVKEEVQEMLTSYIYEIRGLVILTIGVFILINVLFSILFTHRLIGPSFAFRRHIQKLAKGDYAVRTTLRKGDAFSEVADDLNRLSEALEKKQKDPTRPEP